MAGNVQKGLYPHGQAGVAVPLDVVQPLALHIVDIPLTVPVPLSHSDFILTADIDCIVNFGGGSPNTGVGYRTMQVMLWGGERVSIHAVEGMNEITAEPLVPGSTGRMYVQYIQPWVQVGNSQGLV